MNNAISQVLVLFMFVALPSFLCAQPNIETIPLAFGTVAQPANLTGSFGPNYGNSTFQLCSYAAPSPYSIITYAQYVSYLQNFYAVGEFAPSAAGSYSDTIYLYYSSTTCPNSNLTLQINASGTLEASNVLNPVYQVTSIIYAPPGNKSQDGYTDTTTNGTTTTIGSSFTYGQSITFTEGITAFGSGGSASEGFGASKTASNSTAFTETFLDASGVANASASTNPDAIDHDLDLFLIWLNPQVTVSGIPPTPTSYSIGIQPTANGQTPLPDILEVSALVMEPNAAGVSTVPASLLNQQYNPATGQYTPGLAAICKSLKTTEYNADACTLADQCGCTPTDFAPILQKDLLLYYNGTSKPISPYPNTASPLLADTSGATACATLPTLPSNSCRYVPVSSAPGSTLQETATLTGPDCLGCGGTPNTFMQGENSSNTITQGQQTAETVTFSLKEGTMLFSVTETGMLTWTQSQSTGTTTGSGVSLAVTLNTATVGCNQDIPVYEDTVYHTFVFQQPGGTPGASCTTATAKPNFLPAAGTYSQAKTVTISTATTGATIYYTTNGSTPTTSSTVYTGPISVKVTETIKAISHFPGFANSPVGSAKYTIT
jgi:hypothetical protein